ncbi:DmsC/YnfH family molybdoenzyme membrane anchor subunit [Trinickia sp. NRRL B-1857]|uniref:dimethyl sulfoxide reductase anchor subunit family protein n=1 Tax=Trinickia sp. NRRL B-1857 TaxID=3162879 RepID=UPI003D2804FA
MRPAFSVIFLTTLCGAAQGLLLALVGVQVASGMLGLEVPSAFYVCGAALAVVLGILGLVASFFHLGHPERAWRAIAMWRTSWLSRECIALPMFLALAAAYGAAHWVGASVALELTIGALAAAASLALFVCTAMIYACLRFLQEWASPLTLVNFVLLGCASGCTLATACAAWLAPTLMAGLASCAGALTLAGCATRLASLARNVRLKPKSTVQSATGIRNTKVTQTSRGFTASAFNTREFFHGCGGDTLRVVKVGFLAGAFAVPMVLIGAGVWAARPGAAAVALSGAFVIQYAGLLAERWFFFADARHPQNIYYQRAS